MINLSRLSEADLRTMCKERLEALEHWLRRLIEDLLGQAYGDYFFHTEPNGDRILKKQLAEQVEERRSKEASRYPRKIDAILLEDAISIVCNEKLFKMFFREPLSRAYPGGSAEARTFLGRLLVPRNQLAHSNSISVRQAEQVVCYTNDFIDSLKSYYAMANLSKDYNVPLILKYCDSFGNSLMRQHFNISGGYGVIALYNDPRFDLRPGEILRAEVEVDPSFDPTSYDVSWTIGQSHECLSKSNILVMPIENKHVASIFFVTCKISSHKDWHRLGHGVDDQLGMGYKVLPPI